MDVLITVTQLMVTGTEAKNTVVQATDIMKDIVKNCMDLCWTGSGCEEWERVISGGR